MITIAFVYFSISSDNSKEIHLIMCLNSQFCRGCSWRWRCLPIAALQLRAGWELILHEEAELKSIAIYYKTEYFF